MFALDQKIDRRQHRLLAHKTISPKELFEIRTLGNTTITHDVTFTSTESEMVVDMEGGLRNVIGFDMVGLSLANPFITISSMNCCLTLTSGTATGTDHFLILPIGDYSGSELETILNDGLTNLFTDDRLYFVYDKETSKFRFFNKSPDTTYFIPANNTIVAQLATPGVSNMVGSVWPTLGFSIDTVAIQLRSKAARAGGGQPGAPVAPANFYNAGSSMTLPIPEDPSVTYPLARGHVKTTKGSTTVTNAEGTATHFNVDLLGQSYIKINGTVYGIASINGASQLTLSSPATESIHDIKAFTEFDEASALANYPLCMPYEAFGRSALNLYQSGLYETPFSLRNSKKMLYLIAHDMESSHHICSAHSTVKKCSAMITTASGPNRRFPDKELVEMYREVPREEQVGMNGVIAVIPVVSQQVQLQGFDHLPVDLKKNPIAKLKRLRLKLVDQAGELVDMRGRSLLGTIQFTMLTH